jgi:hypothetical protein
MNTTLRLVQTSPRDGGGAIVRAVLGRLVAHVRRRRCTPRREATPLHVACLDGRMLRDIGLEPGGAPCVAAARTLEQSPSWW